MNPAVVSHEMFPDIHLLQSANLWVKCFYNCQTILHWKQLQIPQQVGPKFLIVYADGKIGEDEKKNAKHLNNLCAE